MLHVFNKYWTLPSVGQCLRLKACDSLCRICCAGSRVGPIATAYVVNDSNLQKINQQNLIIKSAVGTPSNTASVFAQEYDFWTSSKRQHQRWSIQVWTIQEGLTNPQHFLLFTLYYFFPVGLIVLWLVNPYICGSSDENQAYVTACTVEIMDKMCK